MEAAALPDDDALDAWALELAERGGHDAVYEEEAAEHLALEEIVDPVLDAVDAGLEVLRCRLVVQRTRWSSPDGRMTVLSVRRDGIETTAVGPGLTGLRPGTPWTRRCCSSSIRATASSCGCCASPSAPTTPCIS
ncbi:hypothetical protein GKE82_23795 [Conexibacter sp. W3-3-2]|uniref:hypothetical protein n=1 Tax=Conexibacter sp. W3-3-2 TaxID=2675227 RepID=UPI0012B6DFAC|nr:hypothetical protein [Conexibacter sp. W3-3-2]MTD47230.1 hypothetical protein [Conexibacter sp. W3-3-2]